MPTYTYQCRECGHSFDLFHGILENGTRECPVCHGQARRLIGAGAGLIFKGSGFYETDYKRKSNGNGNGSAAGHTHSSTGSAAAEGTKFSSPAGNDSPVKKESASV